MAFFYVAVVDDKSFSTDIEYKKRLEAELMPIVKAWGKDDEELECTSIYGIRY